MGILGDDGIAVLVGRIEIQGLGLMPLSDGSPGLLVPADRLFLEADIGPVPVLERDPDLAYDEIAAAAHPVRTFAADPNDLVQLFRPLGPVLEAHQVTRRLAISRLG